MKQALSLLILVGLIVYGAVCFPSYLIMIALISGLVIAHEFGHFLVAKRVGVKVERFGFGLPIGPALIEKQIGETKFCLYAALLGGFVSFPDDDPTTSLPMDSPRRFENKSIAARSAIAIAGVVVNFILGYLLMVFVIARWGYPGDYLVSFNRFVSPNTPAQSAGLIPGDKFLKADGVPIKTADILTNAIHSHANRPLDLVIKRHNHDMTITVIPNAQGKIGVALIPSHDYQKVQHPSEIFTKAFTFLRDKMTENFRAMGEIITGKRKASEVSGPVGIIKAGGQMIEVFGIADGLMITALISTILAIMNILPIPMLDGGHLLFMFFEAIQGHPVRKEIQERVIQFSFYVLMGLMVLILWNDIHNYVLH